MAQSWTFLLKFNIIIILLGIITHAHQDSENENTNEKSVDDWWKHVIVYQIYPRSYQDTDADGVGDLKGIRARLKHLEDLAVGAIWLSPIYKSPMVDFGYDISDHTDIDPMFGDMQDFDDLIKDIHLRKMKLIMDFIPNHTSNKHPWFLSSESGGTSGKHADWYIWKEAKYDEDGKKLPPNNWSSIFGGSAWTWSEKRRMYYLHQFDPAQPDLNYRNRQVVFAMQDVLSFWIKRGVDGFRVDAIDTLWENHYEEDEPRSNHMDVLPFQDSYLKHIHTRNQPEIHAVVKDWRKLMDEWGRRMNNKHIFMVMEIYDEMYTESMKYYESGADLPFNMDLVLIDDTCNAKCITSKIEGWMNAMPKNGWPNFVTGNHDRIRITTRMGAPYASVMNLLLLLLPGTPTTYQGEEIGMLDTWVSFEDTKDPWGINFGPELYEKYSRDPCRGPMQWNSGAHAGFSTAFKTWLPVHPDYETHNVQVQRLDGSGTSALQIYKAAARLRKRASFRNKNIEFITVSEDVTSFLRYEPGHKAYLIILNIGKHSSTEDYYTKRIKESFQATGKIVLNSGNIEEDILSINEIVDLTKLSLGPAEGLVVELILREANYNKTQETLNTRSGGKDEL